MRHTPQHISSPIPVTGRFPHLPALDGLRGVAVALVVGYHLWPAVLPGGFLGVDVFFVLSGFLIASLLVAEAESTRRINLRAFYMRRFRRLAPALLLLLLGLSLYAAVWANPAELGRLREHSLWALGYLANWKFISDGTTYTDLVAGQSPLRHVWSLAIEEQFYVVAPALVVVAGRLVAWRPAALRRVVLVGAAVGAVASAALMAALWGDGSDPSRGYFGTDTRAHSLLIGVALGALFVGRPPAEGAGARVAAVGGVLGVVGLAMSVALGTETSSWLQHGGFLLVALAVAGLISSLERLVVLRRVLALRPLVRLGVISYGVYLWHWPIIVLLDEGRTGLDGPVLAAVQVASTLALASASYAVVETPVRRGAVGRRLRGFAPAVGMACVAALAALVVSSTSLPTGIGSAAAAPSGGPPIDGAPSAAPATGRPEPDGPSGAEGIMMLGDSVAHTLAGGTVLPEFEPWRPEQSPFDPSRIQLWSDARPACSFLPGKVLGFGKEAVDLSGFCKDWRADLEAALTAHPSQIVLVVLSNDASDRLIGGEEVPVGSPTHRRLVNALLEDVRDIAGRHGATLALVALPPMQTPLAGPEDERIKRAELMRDEYQHYAGEHPSVRVLDLLEAICPGSDCDRPPLGYDPAWRYDGLHFTAEGARWVAGWLTSELAALPAAAER